jgi:hypothetical protein
MARVRQAAEIPWPAGMVQDDVLIEVAQIHAGSPLLERDSFKLKQSRFNSDI